MMLEICQQAIFNLPENSKQHEIGKGVASIVPRAKQVADN